MANYPVGLDALSNPTTTTKENDPGYSHAGQHSTVNDIAEQLEAKLGIGASLPTAGGVLQAKLDGSTVWAAANLFTSCRNGGMEKWPQGTSIAVAASIATVLGYGPEGWCLKTNANQASHWTQVAGLSVTSQYAAKVGRDSGQTGTVLMVAEHAYDLDEVIRLRGDYVSLGAVLAAGANWSPTSGNLTIRVACGTGAAARRGGSAYGGETTLISQTVALSTTPQTVQYVSSVVVPTNATQMSVSFEWTPVGTAGADDTVIIDDVQVNRGSVPMAFKTRADDDVACLRHFRRIKSAGAHGVLGANGTSLNTIVAEYYDRLSPPMRAVPTLGTTGTASDYMVLDGGTFTAGSASGGPVIDSALPASVDAVAYSLTVASGLTQFRPVTLVGANANAFLDFNARI